MLLTGFYKDHPRRRTDGFKCPLKFRVYVIYSVEDIAILIFLTFGLKLPNHGHFFLGGGRGLGDFETPKRHILGWIRVDWSIDRGNPSTVLTVRSYA